MEKNSAEAQSFLNEQRKTDGLLMFQSGFAAGYSRAKREERQEISLQIRNLKQELKEHADHIGNLYRQGNNEVECILAVQKRVDKLEAKNANL